MIARLRGLVVLVVPGEALVDTGPVTYRVWMRHDLDRVGVPGEPYELRIRQVVKEDSHDLYGFQFEAEESIFVAITGIKGCGPKLAMRVLSGISTEDFEEAVRARDVKRLTSIKGVGAKTALAIIEAMS